MTRQDLTLEKQAHVTRKAPRYIARPDMPDTVEVQHIGVAKGFKYKMRQEDRTKRSNNEPMRAILSIHQPLPDIAARSFV